MANIYKSEAGKQAVEALYRSALGRWPVANRQIIVPTRQGDTFVIASGEEHASSVVLFHGSGANSSVWLRDVADWAQHYRVYAVDLIGEPGFSAPSRPSLRSDAYVAWLDEVWDTLGLERAGIVGVSLGGWLGLGYAVARPERVASLSLISPSGIGRQNYRVIIKAGLLSLFGDWGLRKALRLVAGSGNVPREVTDFVLMVFRHFRPRMERLPIRTDRELAALAMPVQLLVGGKDALLRSKETRDRMERLVRELHVTCLEDAGHLLPRQTGAVLEFLRMVADRSSPAGIPTGARTSTIVPA